MRKRPWLRLLVVVVLLITAWYGYYKLSSTGYHVGLAKRGRVMNSVTSQPVSGAWVIAQWVASGCGVWRCGGTHLITGAAIRTDEKGT